MDLLLKAGADPNLPALEYPMFKAVSYHRTYLMPKLLAAGANPHEPKGIVEHAVAKNDKDALIFLLNHNCDANARGEKNHTALTTAIREGRIDMIDILLGNGADPAVRGQEWPITLVSIFANSQARYLTKRYAGGAQPGDLGETAPIHPNREDQQRRCGNGCCCQPPRKREASS